MADELIPIDGQGSATVFRQSELGSCQKCVRKVMYNRCYGRKPPNEKMLAGSAVDDALTEHNTRRINGLAGFTSAELVDYAVGTFQDKRANEEVRGATDVDAERDMSILLPLYMKLIDPICVPTDTQSNSKYVDPETGLTLVGHLDLKRQAHLDGKPSHVIISDYKFTKKSPKQMNAATSQQLYAYDLMDGEEPHHVELILLRRLKRSPEVVTTSHFVTPGERNSVINVLRAVGRMINNFIYPMADPSEWYCTPNWCDQWDLCRGNGDTPMPLPGEEGYDRD